MDITRLVIFTAVQLETRAVRRALVSLGDDRIAIHTIGIRASRMPAQHFIHGATALVLAGLAGALDPSLNVGDVIVDDPGHLIDVPFRRGAIHCADRIISTPAQKSELFTQTGATAVDMESRIVRRYAERIGIPFINVRAISDTANEALDPAVVGLVNEVGRVKPLALAATLLRRPRLIPYLNHLGKNSQFAANQLGLAVRAAADSLWHIHHHAAEKAS